MFVLLSSFTIILAAPLISGAAKGARYSEWLKYSELQSLNATCPRKDTCTEFRGTEALNNQTCECQISCTRYRTCCIDSPYRDTRPLSISKETCHPVFMAGINVFMITKCNPNWKGDRVIIDNCESKTQNLSDPVGTAPVTNPKTSTTYKNHFCAICNDDDQDSKLWTINIEVRFQFGRYLNNEDFIGELFYDDGMNLWGVWTTDKNGRREFNAVVMEFRIPESVGSIVKICRPDLKTDCAPDWKDEQVRRKCQAYMAAAYVYNATEIRYIGYHNPHCAICNHVSNFTGYVCERLFFPYAGKPPLSFSLLLDINQLDGDKVGEVNQCSTSEVYDPFFKKCRAFVCGMPGYAIRDNKCTRV